MQLKSKSSMKAILILNRKNTQALTPTAEEMTLLGATLSWKDDSLQFSPT